MRAARLSPLVALILLAPGAQAQTTYPQSYPSPYGVAAPSPYQIQPLSDADLLANEIRALAANPLDVNALVRAGELAIKLGDTTAAGTFFARAERIDPRNARLKAGEASLLVSAERPGEALRKFAEAESLGGNVHDFAADRGLAYDLIGEQDRAQRDYRVALRAAPNDETQRRYALSLGIAGKRELALAQIDPLLRKSDRGAWRARAFILAMGGDQAGAERIATNMMPGGLAEGLQPFFALLPTLPPADRAFAVHFGEVRATPERRFDARLVPPLVALAPDPTAPVLAAVTRPAAPTREDRRRDRKRRRDTDRVEVAAVVSPLPTPPSYRALADTPAAYPAAANAPIAPIVAPPLLARLATPPVDANNTRGIAPLAAVPDRYGPAVSPRVVEVAPVGRVPVVTMPTVAVRQTFVVPAPAPAPVPLAASAVAKSQILSASRLPATPVPASLAPVRPGLVTPAPVTLAATTIAAPETVVPVATSPIGPPIATMSPHGPAPMPPPAPVRSEESILASILSDIVVPPSELAAGAVEAAAVPERRTAASVPPAPDKTAADRKAADKKLAEKKLADKKAEAKALADKKAAEEKKKHDPKILEPARIWVQVAGGATEHDLPKEWARVRGKATAAFKGRQGWTTPLRATNRVLTGPFKSESEAQAFVNAVAKDGISGFVFTSEAGQKIEKLAAK